MADADTSARAVDPQAFIEAEIRKLEGVKMNHGKRRRLAKQWREWSRKIASSHR